MTQPETVTYRVTIPEDVHPIALFGAPFDTGVHPLPAQSIYRSALGHARGKPSWTTSPAMPSAAVIRRAIP